ncbi:hypothetical protein CMV30_09360 [Nibricoccus aquaticus]|uniref:Uncharacterized protein n=1 Tax=Nibricoccus aquaticus TaxID=2576891 RepID=A0A290Q638_9BACT|nr:hypothetical protein [Nibricoccus aquaticus]ATC64145.1 hypothetical protein CMV30_09360 [Nibricoccus aquaticus]
MKYPAIIIAVLAGALIGATAAWAFLSNRASEEERSAFNRAATSGGNAAISMSVGSDIAFADSVIESLKLGRVDEGVARLESFISNKKRQRASAQANAAFTVRIGDSLEKEPNQRLEPTPTAVTSAAGAAAAPAVGAAHH